ncbi:hypothetical protein LTS10_005256 [Elasticomyces elasticus]|nr:hypothetical protein LTS10_005256 [Elasticomyces elasticus]
MSHPNPLGSNPPGPGPRPPWCTCGCGDCKPMVWNETTEEYENPPTGQAPDTAAMHHADPAARAEVPETAGAVGSALPKDDGPFE